MLHTTVKSALAAVLIAAVAQSALAAGPVAPLAAPSHVIDVKNGRNGAAAVGAVAGAAILLGVLGAANSANAAPSQPYYVEPQDYGYQPPPPDYGDSYSEYATQNPRVAVEACRRGILQAARRYGARNASVERYYGMRASGPDVLKFRAVITVYYPGAARTSTVVCSVQDGYLVGARAEK